MVHGPWSVLFDQQAGDDHVCGVDGGTLVIGAVGRAGAALGTLVSAAAACVGGVWRCWNATGPTKAGGYEGRRSEGWRQCEHGAVVCKVHSGSIRLAGARAYAPIEVDVAAMVSRRLGLIKGFGSLWCQHMVHGPWLVVHLCRAGGAGAGHPCKCSSGSGDRIVVLIIWMG